MQVKFTFIPIILLGVLLFSCSKDPGTGGNSTIYGTITAYDYNSEFTELKGIFPAADVDVYLIFGGDRSYSLRVRSNYEGIYEFKYLRPGDYTVYTYSKDSTLKLPSEMYAIVKNVTVTENHQSIEVPEIKVFQ